MNNDDWFWRLFGALIRIGLSVSIVIFMCKDDFIGVVGCGFLLLCEQFPIAIREMPKDD